MLILLLFFTGLFYSFPNITNTYITSGTDTVPFYDKSGIAAFFSMKTIFSKSTHNIQACTKKW